MSVDAKALQLVDGVECVAWKAGARRQTCAHGTAVLLARQRRAQQRPPEPGG